MAEWWRQFVHLWYYVWPLVVLVVVLVGSFFLAKKWQGL